MVSSIIYSSFCLTTFSMVRINVTNSDTNQSLYSYVIFNDSIPLIQITSPFKSSVIQLVCISPSIQSIALVTRSLTHPIVLSTPSPLGVLDIKLQIDP